MLVKSDLVKKMIVTKAQAKLEEDFRKKLKKDTAMALSRTDAIKRSAMGNDSDDSNQIESVVKEREKPFKDILLSWDSLTGIEMLINVMKNQDKDNTAMAKTTKQALDEANKLNAYKENILFQMTNTKKILKFEITEILNNLRETVEFMVEKVMNANSLVDDPNMKKSSKKDKATLEVY